MRYQRKRVILFGCLLVSLAIFSCAGHSNMSTLSSQTPFTHVNNNLSQELLLSLDSSNTNLVFSPVGITEILHYAIFASGGNTRNEIVNFLYDSEPTIDVAVALSQSTSILKVEGQHRPYTWESKIETESYVYPSFLDTISQYFDPVVVGASPHADSSYLSIKFINKISLIAKWQDPFESDRTQIMPFYVDFETESEASMMRDVRYLPYTRYGGCHIADLKFKDDSGFLRVILPVEGYGLKPAIEILSSIGQTRVSKEMHRNLVDLRIPKVKLEQEHDLIPPLRDMGVKDAFNPDVADYSRLTPSRPITNIGFTQNVKYDLDEKGVEATATTILALQAGAVMLEEPPQPLILEINRPYLMLIYDSNDLILFVAAIQNPAQL